MSAPARKIPHPAVFAATYLPFGCCNGFAQVALAFLATRSGLTVEQGALLIAAESFPQVWKFFWAPICDITLTRRTWYLISAVAVAGALALGASTPLSPATFPLMMVIAVLIGFAASFLGFASEGLLAHLVPAAERGRYSGWYQAGNLGGQGLGGGLGLWLLTHTAHWQAGAAMAVFVFACVPAVFAMPDVPAESRGQALWRAMANVGIDMWQVARSRVGFLSAVLCFLPVGTGAAAMVLAQADVAGYWKAGADLVELGQGAFAGVVSMVGCVVGGYGCKAWGSRPSYMIYGVLMAATTAVMAVLPATPFVYLALLMIYSLVTGLCYAAFSAVVLDAIGRGNAATKYNAFASLSNFPIWYMGLVLARADTHWGPRQMLWTESVAGVIGVACFVAVAALPQRGLTRAAASSLVEG